MVADQLEDQVKSMLIRTNNEIFEGKNKKYAYACTLCGKEGQLTNIKTHIEANHITSNISHSCECDICESSAGKVMDWEQFPTDIIKGQEKV